MPICVVLTVPLRLEETVQQLSGHPDNTFFLDQNSHHCTFYFNRSINFKYNHYFILFAIYLLQCLHSKKIIGIDYAELHLFYETRPS